MWAGDVRVATDARCGFSEAFRADRRAARPAPRTVAPAPVSGRLAPGTVSRWRG